MIVDYVEDAGFLVPRRFKDLEEALDFVDQGGKVIMRSEHPQDYDGVSGLLESFVMTKEIINDAKKII